MLNVELYLFIKTVFLNQTLQNQQTCVKNNVF